jgi:hypothetical protein
MPGLDHICFEKSSSTFWQVRCCAHGTRRSCKSTTKIFSNFVVFSENSNFNVFLLCHLKEFELSSSVHNLFFWYVGLLSWSLVLSDGLFGALFLPKNLLEGLMSRPSHILVIRFLKGSYQNTLTIYQFEPDVP